MKPFKTTDEQIEILKSRNLIFENEKFASSILKKYSYYDIVNGYKDILLDEEKSKANNDIFKDKETFEHLYSLYYFDKWMQGIIRDATLDFELVLKNAMSYIISQHFGVLENEYLNEKKYKSGKVYFDKKQNKEISEIDNLIERFKKITRDDIEPFKHYNKEHGHIPPWILFKGASLGNMKIFFKLQRSQLKREIILFILEHNTEHLEDKIRIFYNFLNLCYKFRNRASHSGRIFNYNTSNKIKIDYNDYFHNRIGISEEKYRLGLGKSDIYTLMKGFEVLDISTNINTQIYHILTIHLEYYPNDKYFLLSSMGFPDEIIEKRLESIFNIDEDMYIDKSIFTKMKLFLKRIIKKIKI